jgi:hypothetical protein
MREAAWGGGLFFGSRAAGSGGGVAAQLAPISRPRAGRAFCLGTSWRPRERRKENGSRFTMLAAIRRASSLLSSLAAERRPGSSSK